MYFRLNSTNYREYHRSGEEYGDWSESNDIDYKDAKVSDLGYGDVALFPNQREPKRGEDIFVVGVSYSSGDSFGHGTGYHELLWAFTDGDLAFKLSDLLKKDSEDNPDYNYKSGNYVMFEGVKVGTSTWKGYFESLERVFVERLMVV